jgi:hypothetical protein
MVNGEIELLKKSSCYIWNDRRICSSRLSWHSINKNLDWSQNVNVTFDRSYTGMLCSPKLKTAIAYRTPSTKSTFWNAITCLHQGVVQYSLPCKIFSTLSTCRHIRRPPISMSRLPLSIFRMVFGDKNGHFLVLNVHRSCMCSTLVTRDHLHYMLLPWIDDVDGLVIII